jgi:hypothetical protein
MEERQPHQTCVLVLTHFATARNFTGSHQKLDIDDGNPETLGDRLCVDRRRPALEGNNRIPRR